MVKIKKFEVCKETNKTKQNKMNQKQKNKKVEIKANIIQKPVGNPSRILVLASAGISITDEVLHTGGHFGGIRDIIVFALITLDDSFSHLRCEIRVFSKGLGFPTKYKN